MSRELLRRLVLLAGVAGAAPPPIEAAWVVALGDEAPSGARRLPAG